MTKFCVVCGRPLTGRQTVLCADRECHRERKKKLDCKRRPCNLSLKFCIVCGTELTGKQRTHCSDRLCHRVWAKERTRKWRQNNLEHYQDNLEKIKECNRKYYLNNPEKIKMRSREWYRNNRERAKENIYEYYRNNQEKLMEYRRGYYRRIRGLPEDWDLSRESSIEGIMRRWLQESNIEFVEQHRINFENSTWTRVDFYVPDANICLYCDGDYWHSLPEVQERDARANKALEGMGHSVVRMTEAEILDGNRPWWIGELISSKWQTR